MCVQSATKTIFWYNKILKWQTIFSKRFNDKVFEIRMDFYADTKKSLKQKQISYVLTQTQLSLDVVFLSSAWLFTYVCFETT
jgi:hypothetical protein